MKLQLNHFSLQNLQMCHKNPARKERRSIHKIAAGKAITEPETSKKLKHYIE
jgi:hypothetical protein